MVIAPALRALFVGAFAVFVANKAWLRPWVRETSGAEALLPLVGSLPNACEAVMGTILLTGIAAWARERWGAPWSDRALARGAVAVGAVYVLSQEFGLHALGGTNVVDPLDAAASVVGLAVAYVALRRYPPGAWA